MAERVPINSYIVKVASRCNLDCTYCYEYNMGDDTWRSMPKFISPELVDVLADRIAEHTSAYDLNDIYINLHGGEPLLYGLKRTEALIERVNAALDDRRIHWGIQTNGVLLNSEWVQLFDRFGFHLGLSIDGPADVNDRWRIDHKGNGSFEAVMRGFEHLKSEAGRRIFAGCLSVVDPESDPIAVYNTVLSLNAPAIDFLLPHGNWSNLPPTKAADPEGLTPFADWLIPIFDQWFENDSANVQIRTFEEIIEHLAGGPGRLETVGLQPVNLIVVAVNGDIEGVDTLKSIPGEHVMDLNIMRGRFEDVLDHPKFALRQSGLHQLCDECRACPLVNTCGGGYLPHRWSDEAGYDNPSVFCSDLTRLIRHIGSRVQDTLGVRENA